MLQFDFLKNIGVWVVLFGQKIADYMMSLMTHLFLRPSMLRYGGIADHGRDYTVRFE
jgi:hypothetical protein